MHRYCQDDAFPGTLRDIQVFDTWYQALMVEAQASWDQEFIVATAALDKALPCTDLLENPALLIDVQLRQDR